MLDALGQALHDRRPLHRGGLVHHSDRGSRCVSIKYKERQPEAGIEPSVGSFGARGNNALAETIKGLYTTEVIHRRGPWRSFEGVEFATLQCEDWFNQWRAFVGANQPYPARKKPNNATKQRAAGQSGVT